MRALEHDKYEALKQINEVKEKTAELMEEDISETEEESDAMEKRWK